MATVEHDITDRINGIPVKETMPPYRLVKYSTTGGTLGIVLCGATDVPCGINGGVEKQVGEKFRPDDATFYNIRAAARWKVAFTTDVTLGASVYTAANGTVTKTSGTGATYLGIAAQALSAPTGVQTENEDYNLGFVLQDAGSLAVVPAAAG